MERDEMRTKSHFHITAWDSFKHVHSFLGLPLADVRLIKGPLYPCRRGPHQGTTGSTLPCDLRQMELRVSGHLVTSGSTQTVMFVTTRG
ncbi:hypothetical protein E2C01_073902 [Portunus trituberculatus]|uniref:Uncharacterized protein n=1 Tax=Portunus trituberculatus TaxID=210409 RepID=A0A5B7ICW8_PORTR|nr:hypothetical protein [Portunus trituberculatus]